MSTYIYNAFLLCCLGILGLCCTACEERPIKLDANEKLMADTLANNEIKRLKLEYDTWCSSRHDDMVMRWTDSLVKLQTLEIEARLKQNNVSTPKK